jgi:2-oxoglutarate dehydrogenase E2 component (dihydrolipoamide succinyltransferase)
MAVNIVVPSVGESITEVEIGAWLKNPGDAVRKDEPIVTLDSEKATVELAAPESGVMGRILKEKGAVAKVGEVIGYMEKGSGPATKTASAEGAGQAAAAAPRAREVAGPIVMPAAQALLTPAVTISSA